MKFSHRQGQGLYVYLRACMFRSHIKGTLGMTGCTADTAISPFFTTELFIKSNLCFNMHKMFSPFLGFKWFGSLTNLRRKSDAQKDADSVKEVSTDDMGIHPRSPSYATSSEMYTHMGTMPRHSKKDKNSKKSKSKDKANLTRSQSLRPDHVVESPLLSVLSGKGLEVLENPIIEDKTAHIQNRDLPPPPSVDGHSTKLEDENKKLELNSKPHVDALNACLGASSELCLSQESTVQPVLPKKRLKEGDTLIKDTEELKEDSNLIQLPQKTGNQMEKKTAVHEDTYIGSNYKLDGQEEEFNR